jgi:NADH-quinone oxidoreductase subunit L
MTMPQICLLIVLLPLIAAAIVSLFGNKLPRAMAHILTIAGVGAAFVLSVMVLNATMDGYHANYNLYTWLQSGDLQFNVGFLIDNLSAMMMVVVTFVSLMVHIYTIGYMAEDPGYTRFFSYISLFTFAMLMLVMSNNFMQLFFGWGRR